MSGRALESTRSPRGGARKRNSDAPRANARVSIEEGLDREATPNDGRDDDAMEAEGDSEFEESEEDESGDERADGTATERPRQQLRGRRPPSAPLLERDIPALNHAQRRRVLGRWNTRLRGLKRKITDLSKQFPTSSFVFLFTKPIPTLRKTGKWCVNTERSRFVRLSTRNSQKCTIDGWRLTVCTFLFFLRA